MINQKLLVSGADFFADEFEINPYYNKEQIDVKKLVPNTPKSLSVSSKLASN